jgi:cysteine synthase A
MIGDAVTDIAAARAVGARSVLMLTGVTSAERVATLAADQQPTLVAADTTHRYLGDATCVRCHAAEAAQWKTTAHSLAWSTLVRVKKDATPECVPCHTVGHRKPGGFTSGVATPDLVNVQCENCHGMGTEHDSGAKTRGPWAPGHRGWPGFDPSAALRPGHPHRRVHPHRGEPSRLVERHDEGALGRATAGACMDVLDAIGNTSLVRLRKVVPPRCAVVLVKLEWENPTGSVKDRMANAVISRAEADGRLKPGGTVVEYTGGSTGAALALVCAAKGYRIKIVSSDAFSPEKLNQMAAFGAEITIVPSEGGKTTKKLILDMIETARRLSLEPNTYWTDQLNNHDSIAGYHALGEEIWTQTNGEVDAFVHCVGTAASLRGVATVLKRHKPSIQIVAVEPAESSVLLGGEPGPHKIEGVGIGYTPPLWEPSLVDEIVAVKTDDAKEMARRIAREEALFAGTSSGADVLAAIRVGERLGPGAKVVTLMADSGLKYLNTDVYRRS